MSVIRVGKYRVSASSFGTVQPKRVQGQWVIYDTTADNLEPVKRGECATERDNDDAAIGDALQEGRRYAEGLIAERISGSDPGIDAEGNLV